MSCKDVKLSAASAPGHQTLGKKTKKRKDRRRPNIFSSHPLSAIPWQTLLSHTLYFIHILMGLATTLVHGRLWGVYQKLLLSLYSHGWQKRPLKRLSHPFFTMSISLFLPRSPSSSLPLHAPKGFVR